MPIWLIFTLCFLIAGFLVDLAAVSATALTRRRKYGCCETRPYRCQGCGRPADGNRRQGQTAQKGR